MYRPRHRTEHQHRWDVITLEDEFVPGIPSYVTRCACGMPKPTSHVPAHAAVSAA